jgi:hypothetical protein
VRVPAEQLPGELDDALVVLQRLRLRVQPPHLGLAAQSKARAVAVDANVFPAVKRLRWGKKQACCEQERAVEKRRAENGAP